MSFNDIFSQADALTRRHFMRGAAQAMLGLGAMPLLSRLAPAAVQEEAQKEGKLVLQPATARRVIYLYMSGGMSHLDTFDLKPGADSQGPTKAISTNVDGIQISSHFKNLAKQMDKVTVLNSMFSNQGAHVQGRYLMHTSYELRGTIKHPSLGAWLNRMSGKHNPRLPGHVAVAPQVYTASAGFFESQYMPLPIGDPETGLAHSRRNAKVDEATFKKRMTRLELMNEAFRSRHAHKQVADYDEMYQQAVKLMKSSDLAAFDVTQESAEIRDAYGRNSFGQGCLLARRLVENDVRFVEVVNNGWDSHNENFEVMEDKIPDLDQALSALLADLDARGLLEETLVVVATEFGRTPGINGSRNGRDHHPKAFSSLLAGGGIKGGFRWGKTDELGNDIVEDKVKVQDFNATIAKALGLPLDHTIYSPSGRPFTIADKGKAIDALFA